MAFSGRYYSTRDTRFIQGVNRELINTIIQNEVLIYKLAADETFVNIYGESSKGKSFYPGIKTYALVKSDDITEEDSNFGVDRKHSIAFSFLQKTLEQLNVFPESGDILWYNNRPYEVDNVVQEQFLTGPENSLSIIVSTHMTTLSKINVLNRS